MVHHDQHAARADIERQRLPLPAGETILEKVEVDRARALVVNWANHGDSLGMLLLVWHRRPIPVPCRHDLASDLEKIHVDTPLRVRISLAPGRTLSNLGLRAGSLTGVIGRYS